MSRSPAVEGSRTELGDLGDLEAVDALINVNDIELIDVGCGSGDAARGLADRGAKVLGMEPDPVQADRNRSQSPTPGVTLVEASAEAVPANDSSTDGVFFFRSLHHVPIDCMDQALNEAARVLKPSGFLYVVEPAMDCTFFRMMRPFHDESEVRTRAQEALARTADALFEEGNKFQCLQRYKYANFDALVERFTGLSFNQITRDMMDQPEVRENFAAGRASDGFEFEQPMLINLYRRPRH